MKATDIVNGNKLIAEFMGVKPIYNSFNKMYQWGDGFFFMSSNDTEEKTMEDIISYVKYATSWDWLMPVVKECNTINHSKMEEYLGLYMFTHNSILLVWGAVLMFIEWYNQQK